MQTLEHRQGSTRQVRFLHTKTNLVQLQQFACNLANWDNGPYSTAGLAHHSVTLSLSHLDARQPWFTSASCPFPSAFTTNMKIHLSPTWVQSLQCRGSYSWWLTYSGLCARLRYLRPAPAGDTQQCQLLSTLWCSWKYNDDQDESSGTMQYESRIVRCNDLHNVTLGFKLFGSVQTTNNWVRHVHVMQPHMQLTKRGWHHCQISIFDQPIVAVWNRLLVLPLLLLLLLLLLLILILFFCALCRPGQQAISCVKLSGQHLAGTIVQCSGCASFKTLAIAAASTMKIWMWILGCRTRTHISCIAGQISALERFLFCSSSSSYSFFFLFFSSWLLVLLSLTYTRFSASCLTWADYRGM